MPQANVIQAQFPRGARVIANPHGTAPGIDVQLAGTARTARCFALPGVPAEMREMWDESVTPALHELLGAAVRVIRHRCIKCFGVGESDLEQMLPDLIRRGRRPAVGITVSRATITLRITAEADSVASCEALIAPTEATIRRQLGELVFGEEDDELEHAVVRLLAARGQSVAVAEWGTGGLVAQWLAQAARGQPERLRGWYGIGNLAAFDKLVAGVPAGDVNPASPEAVAERMARACCALFDADYALAVGPFPDRDGPGQEPGRVGLALAAGSAVQTHAPWFAGHPDILAARVAKQALDLLRRELMRSG